VQVNIPFALLYESYLSRFLEYGLNPEIGFDAAALDRFSPSEIEGVAKRIHKQGLSITLHAPYMDLSPGSPDPAIRTLTRHRFQQVVELIPIFEPRAVVCHTGYDYRRYWSLKDAWIDYSVELWLWLAEAISKKGAKLMLENVYEQEPHQFLEVYGKLKGKDIGFCLDTGHQAVFSLVELPEWLKTLGEHIDQLHLHDNLGTQDDHLALGKGKVDFKMLFNYLKHIKREPPIITIEPHREEDLWPSLEYLEGIWPW